MLLTVIADAQSGTPIIGGEGGLSDFTLTLHAPGYAHAVQILAAAPAPAGKPTSPDDAFAPPRLRHHPVNPL